MAAGKFWDLKLRLKVAEAEKPWIRHLPNTVQSLNLTTSMFSHCDIITYDVLFSQQLSPSVLA